MKMYYSSLFPGWIQFLTDKRPVNGIEPYTMHCRRSTAGSSSVSSAFSTFLAAAAAPDRLALQALVSREVHTADRRQVDVKLTASGSEILEKLAAAHKEELRCLCAPLHSALQKPSPSPILE